MTSQGPTITIAILSGSGMVGQALELLLRDVGYDTRLLIGLNPSSADEQLDGVHVLLLAPNLSNARREAFLKSLTSNPATATIPVLELATFADEAQDGQMIGRRVLWPCRLEDLKGEIETMLQN